jgi:hypothetical protein
VCNPLGRGGLPMRNRQRITIRRGQVATEVKSCPHRGDQVRTMTSDLCGTRGHNLPVYSCELHGECTHRQVCKGQDAAVKICVGCSDGPWAF